MIRIDHWDRRLMAMARLVAGWSKDPSTHVGCVLADARHRVLSVGFNGLPAGVKDTDERLHDRDTKLATVQHAERNAVSFSAHQLDGATAYIWPLPPCAQCAGGLIQAGITRVVAPQLTEQHSRWTRDVELSMDMFAEAGVKLTYIKLDEEK